MEIDPKSGRVLWTAEERARHKAVREAFKDCPSLEELVARGDIDPERIMTYGGFLALLEALVALKRAREQKGLSMAEVAARSGIDPAALSRLENGRNPNPTFETLTRYASALGKIIHLELRDPETPPTTGQERVCLPVEPVESPR